MYIVIYCNNNNVTLTDNNILLNQKLHYPSISLHRQGEIIFCP